ncbi:MAG: cardiolipin synthase [Desulforhopalus sp.]|jgi:cardiolipin synthase
MSLGLFAVIASIMHVLGILSAVKAIMESRTPQGAIAWALGLVTFPYIAVPAYWVFGRSKFQGFVMLLREDKAETGQMSSKYIEQLKEHNLILSPDRQEAMPVEKLAMLPFTVGNEAELLIDGEATFNSIFEGIDRAQHYILVQFYIVKADGLGNELKDKMIESANKGVRVYFLYDEIGSMGLTDQYVSDLLSAGVKAHKFNTTKGRTNRFQVNFRNHRKIVVVDGKEAWVGGHNVADEYLGKGEIGKWRDTHVRIAGPAAQSIQVSFVEDYHWAADEMLHLNWIPEKFATDKPVAVLALPSGPADEFETCTLLFMKAIQSAKTRLWIASPYFVPDEQFITALHLAVLRGVDVRILIPRKTDNPLVNLTHWAYIKDLKRIGVTLFWFDKGFLHQKVVLIDDDTATIGTANFDNRSFRLNFEITLLVVNKEFGESVSRMLEEDFRGSPEIFDEELSSKGAGFRFLVRAAQLTAPIQ